MPFFPSLNTKGFLQVEPMTSVDNETKYVQGREKEALLFPKKAKDFSKLFNYYKEGFIPAFANGTPHLGSRGEHGNAVSDMPQYDLLQCNHYFLRSRQEFQEKIDLRRFPNNPRCMENFDTIDKMANEVKDTLLSQFPLFEIELDAEHKFLLIDLSKY